MKDNSEILEIIQQKYDIEKKIDGRGMEVYVIHINAHFPDGQEYCIYLKPRYNKLRLTDNDVVAQMILNHQVRDNQCIDGVAYMKQAKGMTIYDDLFAVVVDKENVLDKIEFMRNYFYHTLNGPHFLKDQPREIKLQNLHNLYR